MKSTCDKVQFISPKYGTKFLLLQRLSEGSEQNSICRTNSCNVNTATASVSNVNEYSRPSVSNNGTSIQKVGNLNHNGNGLPPRKRKRKRKRWNRVNQSDCYPPIPVMSREHVTLARNKVSDQQVAMPIPLSANVICQEPVKLASKNASNQQVVLPIAISANESQSLNDNSRLTGSITQELFQNQNRHRQNFYESISEKSLDLSISEESRERVTLTPFIANSSDCSHNTEQEVIIISSDSSNRTEASGDGSNSISPSLLDGTSPSEIEKEGVNANSKNSTGICVGPMKKRSISSTMPVKNIRNKTLVTSPCHSDMLPNFQTSQTVQKLLPLENIASSNTGLLQENVINKCHVKDSENRWSCIESNCLDDSVRTLYHSLTSNRTNLSNMRDNNESSLSIPASREGIYQSNDQANFEAITDFRLVSTKQKSLSKEKNTEVHSSETSSGEYVEISKKGHKCLKLIVAVLASDFEVSQNECFNILKKNEYNILATILDLQTRNPEV